MNRFFLVFLYLLAILIAVVNLNRAHGDEMVFDLGVGIFNSASQSATETKYFTFSLQETLWQYLKDRFVVGGWIDNTGNGRGSSAFGAAQLGVEVDNNGFVASVFTGPALMSTPDSMLGSYLEFYHTLSLGIHDVNGNYIGAAYHHMSNAGISSNNLGRDLLGLELKFPF